MKLILAGLVLLVVGTQAQWYKFPSQAYQGSRDMHRAYTDMKEANWKNSDKYFHARGNRDAASRGAGGRFAARVISAMEQGQYQDLEDICFSDVGPLSIGTWENYNPVHLGRLAGTCVWTKQQATCPVYSETRVNPGDCNSEASGARMNWTMPDSKSKKPCNCTKSQCLKRYFDCFAKGELCSNCNCLNCCNNAEHYIERQNAILNCLDRNPEAFKFNIVILSVGRRSKGTTRRVATANIENELALCSTCAGSRDMHRAYTDMKKARDVPHADKYFHARGNYDAANRGAGGRFAARVIRVHRGFPTSLNMETVGTDVRTQLLTRKLTDGGAAEEIPIDTDLKTCLEDTEDKNIYLRRCP
ncbi:Serum amyloid A-2 protein [Merluccius polli]|uniref:Serum amyloid A-2 protein n=1 Tax=Merluccius polli TaxID=89951 RepID=A0AA47M4V4_MERPO|nr:Serum amyloid A-2 protein [Merluccius polli]